MANTKADRWFMKILNRLNEAQARWYVAREAMTRGRGGVKAMQELTGMSKPTILRGKRELLESRFPQAGRIRRPGGGRKRIETSDPDLIPTLKAIMEENAAGDPMSRLQWTHLSTQSIAEEMTRREHPASTSTIHRRLRELEYSMQANRKSKEGYSPPARDAQFRYINRQANAFLRRGDPVISVDCKKKEKIGNLKNPGKNWRKKGKPQEVEVYDFVTDKVAPYGIYDIERNEGFVNVGISSETGEFAAQSIRRWWKSVGRKQYPRATSLLTCCDSGGGNGSNRKGWKYHLQEFADESGLEVTVCHYPPGTSKWNKIEHRMFSFISINWQGQPLISHQVVLKLIAATRTKSGLRIRAKLDRSKYKTGIEYTKEQMESIAFSPHATHPKWNYTIAPRAAGRVSAR